MRSDFVGMGEYLYLCDERGRQVLDSYTIIYE